MKRVWQPWFYLAVFFITVAVAWAWFNFASPGGANTRWVQAGTNVPGYVFSFQAIGPAALEILSTPEYLNGTFQGQPSSNRITERPEIRVFSANWPADRREGMTVMQHTPDVCWVGAGWRPIDLGQPKRLTIRFPQGNSSSRAENSENSLLPIDFECRAFRAPDQGSIELVIWCTLVGGRYLSESLRFRENEESNPANEVEARRSEQLAAGRRLTADFFRQAVRQRIAVRGVKQFIRLSRSVNGSWQDAIEDLTRFARQWLVVRIRVELGGAQSSNRNSLPKTG